MFDFIVTASRGALGDGSIQTQIDKTPRNLDFIHPEYQLYKDVWGLSRGRPYHSVFDQLAHVNSLECRKSEQEPDFVNALNHVGFNPERELDPFQKPLVNFRNGSEVMNALTFSGRVSLLTVFHLRHIKGIGR